MLSSTRAAEPRPFNGNFEPRLLLRCAAEPRPHVNGCSRCLNARSKELWVQTRGGQKRSVSLCLETVLC